RRHHQEALVEERVAGREIRVALLGNAPVKCLPLVEVRKRGLKLCPARLDHDLEKRIRRLARRAFRACDCRDYAPVDFRLTRTGAVWLVEAAPLGALPDSGPFARPAAEAGYSYPQMLDRIVEPARARRTSEPTTALPAAESAAPQSQSPIGLTSTSALE